MSAVQNVSLGAVALRPQRGLSGTKPRTSVVLPVFNEARNLRQIVAAVVEHALQRPDREFIFVNDGSADDTQQVLANLLPPDVFPNVRFVGYPDNRGKGYAVRFGFRHAHGDNLIFTDGDLAYSLDHLDRIEAGLATHDVAIGSRQLLKHDGVNERSFLRAFLGEGFNRLVRLVAGLPFEDTQAGLKGFRREVADYIGDKQRALRYSVDVEMLFIAKRHGWTITEVPAIVSDDHASKASRVDLLRDPLKMLRDLVKIRWNGVVGRYD